MQTQTNPEPLVDINVVADHLNLSTAAIRKWRQKGTMPFPTYKVGRLLRYKLSEVNAYVQKRAHRNAVEARYLDC